MYGEGFIEWLKNNSKRYHSVSDLSRDLNIYIDLIHKICKENSIEFNYKKNDPRYRKIYQDYDWCYEKFINEGLNHEEMSIEANCSKRVIKKWCVEKHRLTAEFRKENKQLSQIQRDLIIGSMLGDGHIDKREAQPIFIVVHAENQKDYLYYKYNILKDLCNKEPSFIKESIHNFGQDKMYKCQPQYRISTRIYDCFKDYRGKDYTSYLKQMNEFSFSIWMLDDGYRGDAWQLCVAEYTQDDIDYAINKFQKDYNLLSWQKKDKRYLQFDADSSRKIDKIILNNIPNDLDIIQDKIINNKKIRPKQKRVFLDINGDSILLKDFCRDNKLNYKRVIGRTYKGVSINDSIKSELNVNGGAATHVQ